MPPIDPDYEAITDLLRAPVRSRPPPKPKPVNSFNGTNKGRWLQVASKIVAPGFKAEPGDFLELLECTSSACTLAHVGTGQTITWSTGWSPALTPTRKPHHWRNLSCLSTASVPKKRSKHRPGG